MSFSQFTSLRNLLFSRDLKVLFSRVFPHEIKIKCSKLEDAMVSWFLEKLALAHFRALYLNLFTTHIYITYYESSCHRRRSDSYGMGHLLRIMTVIAKRPLYCLS